MTGSLSSVQFMTGNSDPQTHATIAGIMKIQLIITFSTQACTAEFLVASVKVMLEYNQVWGLTLL